MIPFCLYKYICLRWLIYNILINYIYIIIIEHVSIVHNFLIKHHVIDFILTIIYIICSKTFLLNMVIFKKYKHIKIITNLQCVNGSMVLDMILLELGVRCIVWLTIFVLQLLISNNITLDITEYILNIILYYFAINMQLQQYIKVTSNK